MLGTPNALEVATQETLDQIAEAHRNLEGFGESGEFTVGRIKGDSIVFVIRQRFFDSTTSSAVAFESALAEPMRLALQGKSGTVIGFDYRGVRVLAAYESIPLLGLGVVAKIDLAEIRAPFLRAAAVVGGLSTLIVALGILLFWRISTPMIRRLSESEERLNLALDGARDGIWDWEIPTGKVIYGERWASMLGRDLSDLEQTYQTLLGLMHPDDLDRIKLATEEHFSGESEHYSVEFRLRCKTGEWKWILSRGKIVARDSQGTPTRMVGTHYDIDELKSAQEALQHSEARFRAIFERSPVGIALSDTEGHALLSNASLQRLVGLSGEELAGQPFVARSGPSMDENERRLLQSLIAGERESYQSERQMICKDGSQVWASVTMGAIRDEKNRLEAIVTLVEDISGRKATAAALLAHLAFLDTLLNTIPSPVFYKNAEGIYLGCNEAFAGFIGLRPEEIIGKSVHEIEPPEIADKYEEKDRELFENPGTQTYEWRVRHSSGETRDVVFYKATFGGQGGCPEGIIGLLLDITDRKRAEEELSASEEKFKTIAESSPDAIFVADRQGNYVYTNRTASELLGYSTEELATMSIVDVSRQDQIEETKKSFAELLAMGKMFVEIDLVRADGSVFPADLNAVVLPNNLIYGSCRDITGRKQVERKLQESEERFKSIVTSSFLSIAMVNLEGRVTLANRAAAELHGYPTPELMIGLPIAELCADAAFGSVAELQQRLLEEGPVQPIRIELRRRDGTTFPAEMSLSPILDSDHKVTSFVGIAQDITQQLRMQEELTKTDKLESIGVLAGGIAHDFNNILTAIIGYISFAQLEVQPGTEIQQCLIEAEAASQRAAQLTKQLLTFARGGAPLIENISISEVIGESARFALSGTGVKPDFYIQENLPAVNADAGQLSQVINNLLINASQAMEGSGTVKIAVEQVVLHKIGSVPIRPGKYVLMTITDEGIGIPEENLSRIFDPYFTTKAKGSGLGLASTYSIIKKHGGYITVESTLGKGTTFYVYLPAVATEVRSRKAADRTEPPKHGEGRILIVDDEKPIRELARAVLEALGFETDVAEDGNAALDMYEQAAEADNCYTVVIIDLTMPGGMGGKELIHKLLEID
ncbi:MAG: PAS domain S-box protein, partial [bacterium]